VIKIEAPSGDPARGFMKIIGAMAGLSGNNYYFEHNNRNKRAMVLDLKADKGMEAFLKLIDRTDVFLNNMSIKAPQKWALGRRSSLRGIQGSSTPMPQAGAVRERMHMICPLTTRGLPAQGS